jgi:hypothetical protein
VTEHDNVVRTLEAVDVLAEPVIDVAGVATRLKAEDSVRGAAVASLFRHAEVLDVAPACSLCFRRRDVAVPASAPATANDRVELWWSSAGELRLRTREGLTARSTATEIVIGGQTRSLNSAFRAACTIAVANLLMLHGRFLFHAAAVAPSGAAILVLGETGMGKSTLALAAHRLGWSVLADDMVVMYPDGPLVRARGVSRPVSVPVDVADAPPGARAVPGDPRQRIELPSGVLSYRIHPVAALLAIVPNQGTASLVEPLTGRETFPSLLAAAPVPGDRGRFAEVFSLSGTLARLPAWAFRRRNDPCRAIEDATVALETVAHLLDERGRAKAQGSVVAHRDPSTT